MVGGVDKRMRSFAFVFPGQGSQAVGMLDAWGDHPAVSQVLEEASQALGEDMRRLIAQGPKEALAMTTNTQPVMLIAGVAAYRVWLHEGGATPAVVAGHSLGEYSALVAAGVLTLGQAAPLVRFRAQAMQEAVPVGQGAMAASLGMSAEQVLQVCQTIQATFAADSGEVVQAVNFNDPKQTVIAGSKLAVEQAMAALKEAGAKRALPLPVSAPFHSSLMRPAADRLAQRFADVSWQAPSIPVVNNVDVAIQTDVVQIQEALVRQAYGPVRWVECIAAIEAQGVQTVVECGPGKVLAGMTSRINPSVTSAALYDPATLAQVQEMLQA
jgi:[acyl-carrier-protein] S-malonyltransferase